MMMSYHSRDNKKRKIKVFIIILLLFVLFFYTGITKVFRNTFQFLIYPIWTAESYIDNNTINPFGFLMSKKKLLVNNDQLKKDLMKAEEISADRNLLIKENIELKEILGRVNNPDSIILASVISKPNTSFYDTLIVDAGSNLGIEEGADVFVFGNIAIGTVEEVSKKTSKIKLFSSPEEKNQVRVGIYNIDTIATGRGGGDFEIKLPRDIDVQEGDPVTLKGKFLGSVEKITFDPVDSFKSILIKSPINIYELQWVQILKSE